MESGYRSPLKSKKSTCVVPSPPLNPAFMLAMKVCRLRFQVSETRRAVADIKEPSVAVAAGGLVRPGIRLVPEPFIVRMTDPPRPFKMVAGIGARGARMGTAGSLF